VGHTKIDANCSRYFDLWAQVNLENDKEKENEVHTNMIDHHCRCDHPQRHNSRAVPNPLVPGPSSRRGIPWRLILVFHL
jgi:hypothetical protein